MLEAIQDVSGDGVQDYAHVGKRDDTGATRIQIKRSEAFGRVTISNAFLGDVGTPIELVGIGDVNSSTFPDVALLVENPFDGSAKVIVRDGKTGEFIRNIFLGAIRNPVGMALIQDRDGNGFMELAILGDNDGTPRVQIKDSKSGAQVWNIDFP